MMIIILRVLSKNLKVLNYLGGVHMLQHLQIENFALIDKLSLELSGSLNVLTGETGAGKSIIIDSINFVFGGRVSKDIVRTGKEKAIVEAVFNSLEKLRPLFDENGLNFDEESIILYREFNSAGKNVCRVNGRMVNTSILSEIGQYLVDMHGQHDNQSLMKSSLHMSLLDLFCGNELFEKLAKYKEILFDLRALEKEIEGLKSHALERKNKIDFLKFQINEILSANLVVGEDDELENKRSLMKNWERISECLTFAYAQLSESNDGKPSANDQIALAASKLLIAAPYNNEIFEITEKINETVFQLQDISSTIRDFIFGIEFSTIELEQTEERLDVITRLKKKYGIKIENIFEFCEKASEELEIIDISPEKIFELEKIYNHNEIKAHAMAQEISFQRKKVSKIIELKVAIELEDLEMRGAAFEGKFSTTPLLTSGIDKMEFLFSANKGEPVKPLSKIASGGEMSRVMLAIKSILAEVDQIPLLIFDEIDSGISGIASQKVGEKLKRLAKNHQIICVTHHAQIAAMANRHFCVSKLEENNKTITKVENIFLEKRIAEIGRLLSGTHLTDISKKHAQELLENREKEK